MKKKGELSGKVTKLSAKLLSAEAEPFKAFIYLLVSPAEADSIGWDV